MLLFRLEAATTGLGPFSDPDLLETTGTLNEYYNDFPTPDEEWPNIRYAKHRVCAAPSLRSLLVWFPSLVRRRFRVPYNIIVLETPNRPLYSSKNQVMFDRRKARIVSCKTYSPHHASPSPTTALPSR